MKQIIAIPTNDDCLCQHFGHCGKFAVFQAENNKIIKEYTLDPPPHEPGVLPGWLAARGITHVIAGGMGHRAISLFNSYNIQVFTGAEEKSARTLAEELLDDKLTTGINTCNH
jgi:predicted Fe-Mo cluster-binding NifX family protein